MKLEWSWGMGVLGPGVKSHGSVQSGFGQLDEE